MIEIEPEISYEQCMKAFRELSQADKAVSYDSHWSDVMQPLMIFMFSGRPSMRRFVQQERMYVLALVII